ncbi:MAG: RagB/SusD family nutrient uptake outer membrane protein [Prevotella sp.]|nr:RagB/SusD family nutrient uptake outer membrane protein [Prevotella sp.]
MKRNIIYIISMAAALSLTSCDDLFEPALENNLGVDYMYRNPQYAEGVLANAYTYLVCDGYPMSEMATDDAVCNQPSNGYRNMAAGTWTSGNNPMNVWETCYNKIMYLNLFLNRCDRVDWAEDQKASVMYNDREKGEAYGLRAMNLYHLLQAHSGYGTDGVLYGVPIILTEFDATTDNNLPRNTFAECVEQIYSDCDNAMSLLPMSYGDITDESGIPAKYVELAPTAAQYTRVFGTKFTGRMVGRIVQAYRTRTALLAASPAYNPTNDVTLWERAANYAAVLIDDIGGIGGMDPKGWTWYCNTSEISGLKNGENPKEILWRGAKNQSNSLEAQNYPPSIYGNGYCNPTQNFVDCFPDAKGYPITSENTVYDATQPYRNRDPRLDKYVVVNGSKIGSGNTTINTSANGSNLDGLNNLSGSSTRTGYYLRKLLRNDINLNPVNPSTQLHYNAYIRYTEIFLDYAEAANEAWGPTQTGGHAYSAYDVIKALHNRCGAGNDYLESIKDNKNLMRELIRNERRIELSFENHRFWDLRRWKVSLDKLNETARGISINSADKTYTPIDVDTRNYKEHMFYGPIPYSECLKFDRLQQNAGW